MKILIVNCVYAYGSTGKIVQDIASGLYADGIEVVVAYGRGDALQEKWETVKLAPEGVMKLQSLVSKLTGDVYGCSPVSTASLFRLIEKECPDIVNLHCINANTVNQAQTIAYLKQYHIKTVLTVHAEYSYTGGCGHAYDCGQWKTGCRACGQFHKAGSQLPQSWMFCRTHLEWERLRKAYEGFEELAVTCVSPWLASRAKQSPFFQGRKIVAVINGLNEEVFRPRDASRLRALHGLEGKKVVLHVTPNFYSSIKGGNYVLAIARRLETERPDCCVVVCGYRGSGEDLPGNVVAIPFTRNQEELAEYYSLADVTLLASKRETFSMVTAETICCGTPLVGFRAGGPESIAMPGAALFCDYGDTDTLYSNLCGVLTGKSVLNADARKAREIYSKKAMKNAYKKVYEELVGSEQ